MVFSSPGFLFGFLPITLLLYYLSPRTIKNFTLLVCSLLFYAWGEVFYIGIIIGSIISNYIFGLLIYGAKSRGKADKLTFFFVFIAIAINLVILISFKYANFLVDNSNSILVFFDIPPLLVEPVHLPLGISFFTFQAISYIVDLYRGEAEVQKNILKLALYISLFPQLIAGPIVRYHDISAQILKRNHSIEKFARGVRRFIYGLAKKMLIANPLGEVADLVFAIPENDLTLVLAWIGILAYTLQIFYDFSGYSDMAIGLGLMFGFKIKENFNFPYIATSVRDFWRRWHISLSTWFRDYVYISLGGSRVSTMRVYVNLLIVFCLTGFWHGASWNFLIWGMFHGLFLGLEHAGLSAGLNKLWKPLQHLYLLLIVIFGWVFFRAESLQQAICYIKSMLSLNKLETTVFQFAQILSYEAVYAFLAGIILCMPVIMKLKEHLVSFIIKNEPGGALIVNIPRFVLLTSLLLLCVIKVVSSSYNPFIYFRF